MSGEEERHSKCIQFGNDPFIHGPADTGFAVISLPKIRAETTEKEFHYYSQCTGSRLTPTVTTINVQRPNKIL